ncbi:MAG: acetoacetate decarboxylase family protein [Anaerolineae bacterium]
MPRQLVRLPDGMEALGSKRLAVLILIRNHNGSLVFDELLVGSPVRLADEHTGLYIHQMWVSDYHALWGGRLLWGLHAQRAHFFWQPNAVRIADEQGPVATLRLEQRKAFWPRVSFRWRAVGRLDGYWSLAQRAVRGKPGLGRIRIVAWDFRFVLRPLAQPIVSVRLNPADLTLAPPDLLM